MHGTCIKLTGGHFNGTAALCSHIADGITDSLCGICLTAAFTGGLCAVFSNADMQRRKFRCTDTLTDAAGIVVPVEIAGGYRLCEGLRNTAAA